VLLLIPAEANLFSSNGALRLLPSFLLGLGLRRIGGTLDRRQWLAWSLPAFTVVYGLRLVSVLADVQLAGPDSRPPPHCESPGSRQQPHPAGGDLPRDTEARPPSPKRESV
jgi:hypothetical protein